MDVSEAQQLELAGLRGDVAFVSSEFRLSERTACKMLHPNDEPRLTGRQQKWAMDFIIDDWRPDGWCAS